MRVCNKLILQPSSAKHWSSASAAALKINNAKMLKQSIIKHATIWVSGTGPEIANGIVVRVGWSFNLP